MSEVLDGTDPYTQPSFTLKNRVCRLVWGGVWAVFFRLSPQPCFGWRNFLLRLFGATIGRGCHVYNDVRVWAPWNLEMHGEASMGRGANCYCMGRIVLGERCVVSQGAHLCAGTHDYEAPNFQLVTAPITIGARAWVCTEAFVGPGVTVGEGAVIGARAVATKDMPAWTVCAGNPCRPLKPRVVRSE